MYTIYLHHITTTSMPSTVPEVALVASLYIDAQNPALNVVVFVDQCSVIIRCGTKPELEPKLVASAEVVHAARLFGKLGI